MKRIPAIKSVMTPFPFSVDVNESIEQAKQFMQEHHIRHLPVTKEEELVGILTDRDINGCISTGQGDLKESNILVKDVYTDNPFIVDLNERLDNVLSSMANKHIESVLVTRSGKLAGVFTAMDACRNFAQHLRDQVRPPGGNEAA